MHLPVPGFARPLRRPITTLAELAALVRTRLVVSLWGRPESLPDPDSVVVAAAAPFAPTSFARARLLRQMHASGLLDDRETEQARHLLGVAGSG